MIYFLLDSATINRLLYNCGGTKREKISVHNSQIDDIVRAKCDPQGPGVAVAVVKDGTVIHRQGYGFANLEWQCPITPKTVFDNATTVILLSNIEELEVGELGRQIRRLVLSLP
jgi:hypothetical protein